MPELKEATIEQLMAELATREGIDYRKVEIGEDLQFYMLGPGEVIIIQPE
jgi:uncharacterized protein YheU (UPF0270 family)